MSDTLYGDRRYRTLNILDEGMREGLVIEVDASLPVEWVVRVAGASGTFVRLAATDSARQWAGVPRRVLHELICQSGDGATVYPTKHAKSGCGHRLLQSNLLNRSVECQLV